MTAFLIQLRSVVPTSPPPYIQKQMLDTLAVVVQCGLSLPRPTHTWDNEVYLHLHWWEGCSTGESQDSSKNG